MWRNLTREAVRFYVRKRGARVLDTVKNLMQTVDELNQTINHLTAENKLLKQKLDRINEPLLIAQRARFGQSSEKRGYVLPDSE